MCPVSEMPLFLLIRDFQFEIKDKRCDGTACKHVDGIRLKQKNSCVRVSSPEKNSVGRQRLFLFRIFF